MIGWTEPRSIRLALSSAPFANCELAASGPAMARVPDDRPKQPTQPKGKKRSGEPQEPVEIPVPKRGEVDRLLKRAARAGRDRPASEQG